LAMARQAASTNRRRAIEVPCAGKDARIGMQWLRSTCACTPRPRGASIAATDCTPMTSPTAERSPGEGQEPERRAEDHRRHPGAACRRQAPQAPGSAGVGAAAGHALGMLVR
jgi:hypothetical protein